MTRRFKINVHLDPLSFEGDAVSREDFIKSATAIFQESHGVILGLARFEVVDLSEPQPIAPDPKKQIAALFAAGEALQSALDGCAMRLRFFAEVNSGSLAIKSGEPIDRNRPAGTPTCEQNVEAIRQAYDGWKQALQLLEPSPAPATT